MSCVLFKGWKVSNKDDSDKTDQRFLILSGETFLGYI